MTDLGLIERANLPIARLSGGQRKRTSVGVELLSRPSLLFLDEPTSGLDPASEANLMDLLVDLARDGRTVVLVTHSIPSLERCDRVLYLGPGGRLSFFGVPSEVAPYFRARGIAGGHDSVFRALEERRDVDWKMAFEGDPLHLAHVAGPLEGAGTGGPAAAPAAEARPAGTPWLRQFMVLIRRYGTVIRRDRGVLVLLALQAPIFGLLYVLLFRSNVLSTLFAIEAAVFVWLIALGATWLGTSNAIREIVKELPIYQRERSIGLSTSAYVASKVAVLAAVTVVQTVVMTAIALTTQQLPPDNPAAYALLAGPLAAGAGASLPEVSFDGRGALLGNPYLELFIGAALTGIAAMAVALLVSAVARATDRAATMLPILLIIQTVVSAPLLGLPPPGLREVGMVSTTQWGFSALAATVDLNDIRAPFLAVQEFLRAQARGQEFAPGRTERATWAHDADTWRSDVVALALLSVVSIVGAWFALRRLDPNTEANLRARPRGP
jgi:energy-coupling factor transporter ATP-binding protein EcfA2